MDGEGSYLLMMSTVSINNRRDTDDDALELNSKAKYLWLWLFIRYDKTRRNEMTQHNAKCA